MTAVGNDFILVELGGGQHSLFYKIKKQESDFCPWKSGNDKLPQSFVKAPVALILYGLVTAFVACRSHLRSTALLPAVFANWHNL